MPTSARRTGLGNAYEFFFFMKKTPATRSAMYVNECQSKQGEAVGLFSHWNIMKRKVVC